MTSICHFDKGILCNCSSGGFINVSLQRFENDAFVRYFNDSRGGLVIAIPTFATTSHDLNEEAINQNYIVYDTFPGKFWKNSTIPLFHHDVIFQGQEQTNNKQKNMDNQENSKKIRVLITSPPRPSLHHLLCF